MVVGLSACNDNADKTELSAPVISLQGSTISWSEVEHADGYEVYEGTEKVATQTRTSYVISKTEAGTYTYRVKATSTDDKFITSDFSNEVVYEVEASSTEPETPTQLASPVITLTENIITWQAVDHASIYVIYENDVEVGRQLTTSYTINRAEEGDYTYTVVATSSSASYTQSAPSNEVVYTVEVSGEPVQLSKPVVELDGAVLSWEAVPHATEYIVYEDGDMVTRTAALSYTIVQENVGTYSYTVCATSTSAHYLLSEPSDPAVYTVEPRPLPSPEVELSGYTLSWDEIAGAESYVVFCDGIAVYRATNPGYRLAQEDYGTFSYTVVGYPEEGSENYLPSEPSEPVVVTISDDREQLSTPVATIETRTSTVDDETVETTVLSWSAVPNAEGYEVYENDRRVHVTFTGLEYTIEQVKAGTYNYKVRAFSEGAFKASEFSEVREYVVAVKDIPFKVSIVFPDDYPSGQITVGLFGQVRNLPMGSAVRSVTVPTTIAENGVTLSASNDKTYVAKISSALQAGYAASEARVSPDSSEATITIYKKTNYRAVSVGTNTFNVVSGDGPTGTGVTQTDYLFVAPEAAQYYIVATQGDDMNLWFFDEKCVLEPGQGLRQYAFAADKDEAIEISFAGHSVGAFSYRIVKGELKEQLLLGKGYGQGAVNVIVDGEKSAVRYLTLAEDTMLTFMFGTGNIGMRYVTVTINGVSYDFDGLNNTRNIRIEAGTDIEIRFSISGIYDPNLSMNLAFYVYPIL